MVSAPRLVVLLALAAPAALADEAGADGASCSTALALGLDVSSSVDAAEHRLQRQGLAQAFRDPAVVDAILGGAGVTVAIYEWSGFHQQEVIVGWTWLGDRRSIDAVADRLDGQARQNNSWPTSLGRAVEFATRLHGQNPRQCARRVIDISGDGVNNHGAGPDWYAERGILDGYTVNGLAIRGASPDPADYYRDSLIHGPGAFVEVAEGFEDFRRAILHKLLRELQAPIAMVR